MPMPAKGRQVADLVAAPTVPLAPMVAEVDRSALLAAVHFVSRALPRTRRSIRPILRCVRLRPVDGAVEVSATDLEAWASVPVLGDVRGALPAVVDGKALADALRSLPGERVAIVSKGASEAFGATVSAGGVSSVLPGCDPDDMPPRPKMPERSWSAQGLQAAFAFAAGAAAKAGPSRVLLRGVEVTPSRCLATDGFAARATEYIGAPDMAPYVVEAEAARFLADPLMDGVLWVAPMTHPMTFVRPGGGERTAPGVSITSARGATVVLLVMAGPYFSVMDLVPQAFPTTVRLRAADLAATLAEALASTKDEPPFAVTMEVRPYHLPWSVDFNAGSAGRAMARSVEAQTAGPDRRCGFNAQQMLAGVRALCGPHPAAELLLELSGDTSMARLRRPDGDPERGPVHLQMPLLLPD